MFDVKCKKCRTCDAAHRVGKVPRKHSCRKNWTGSAKAMEPAMAVDMLKRAKTPGEIGTLVMDWDSTTVLRIQNEVNAHIKKKTDENHVKKGVISHIYTLSSTHKILKNSSVRNYIAR